MLVWQVFAPYNSREGEGLYILRHLAEPIVNENYVFHEWLPTTKPSEDPLLIVVTSKYYNEDYLFMY